MPRRENPLGPAEDALTRFAADLRALREDAGTPTYRQLSARAHYSAAALSEAASGRKLPSLPVALAYVRACDGDTAVWEQRWREVSAAHAKDAAKPVALPDENAPYAGFAAIEDPVLFAGRADLVAELTARVRERRLTAVVGASGSGKTSLLLAGLLPTLSDHVVMTPGPRPLEECAVRLADVVGVPPGELYRELAEAPENLHLRVRQAFADRPGDLVLVVDRFEEALADERFVAAIVHAATTTTSRVRVVLAVRADVADRLPPVIQDEQLHVGPLTADGLREAITEPAAEAGCRVETALLVRLIADTGGPGTLPFLQQALLEAWRRRRGTTLTVAGYEAAGDVPRLIADAAEAVFTALDADGQRVARHLLPRLATSRGLRRDDLDADTASVLDELVLARVVVADRDHLRLAGRSLRERWPRLRAWLDEDGDRVRVARELAEATTTWESLGRDPGALYRGVRLDTALAADAPVLTTRERDFLRESVAARAGERWRFRRLRAGLAVLSVLVVLATAALAYAVRGDRTADDEVAAAARSALREAAGLLDTDPALAMQLTIAAHRLAPTEDSRKAVLTLFASPYAARLTEHTGTVHAVAATGDLLATAGDDATRLWDIGDPNHPRDLAVLRESATSVVLSADGRVAVTGTPAGASLWNLTDRTHPKWIAPVGKDNLPMLSPALVALSQDGRTLALSKENDVRLYDISAGEPRRLGTLTGGAEPVTSVAFSPDGATVLTTSVDHAVRLWPAAGGAPVVLTGSGTPLVAATFSPDGRFVATAGEDGTVTMWRVADRVQVAGMVVRGGAVRDVAFSPDGELLAATGDDQSTAVWDVREPARPRLLVVLTGHSDAGTGVRFTPDSRTLITSSRDRTVRLVDLAEVVAGRDGGGALAWDGTVLASGDAGTVRLFDMRDRHAPRPAHTVTGPGPALAPGLLATGGELWDVHDPRRPRPRADVGDATGSALSHDGRFLVTLHQNGNPKLWSVTAPARPLAELPAPGTRAATFGDGVVATLGHDLTLWDLTDPAHPEAIALRSRMWSGMALSRDGTLLAAMARDGVGWLWNVTDPRAPKVLGKIATGQVKAVAFSPDGRLLVTASGSTTRLWDVSDPRRPEEIAALQHNRTVAAVTFSPDGGAFAVTGTDGALRVWDVSVDVVERRVCAVAAPRLEEDVWERYLPGVPYQPVCG